MNTPIKPPRPSSLTMTERLDNLQAIAEIAASRAEIAYTSSDRAEAAARRAEDAVKALTRTALGADGRPGLLPWIGSELVALRADMHPVRRLYAHAVTVAIALVAGGTAGVLLTCDR